MTIAGWMHAHPWLTFVAWCWAWWCLPPLVSVRPYTTRELKRGRREVIGGDQ